MLYADFDRCLLYAAAEPHQLGRGAMTQRGKLGVLLVELPVQNSDNGVCLLDDLSDALIRAMLDRSDRRRQQMQENYL